LLLTACGLIAVVAICFFCLREKEPSYNGRTLSEWVFVYGRDRSTANDRKEAAKAIGSVGNNAIRFLLRWSDYEPSTKRRIWERLPKSISHTRPFESLLLNKHAEYRATYAARAFGALGPIATSAIPELKKRALNTNQPICALNAHVALGAIGLPALPAFLDVASNLGDAFEWNTGTLVTLTNRVRASIPLLATQLHDPNWEVRTTATNILQRFAPEVLTNRGSRR
jgi:hypothetical protein